jgi:hypothetical protein
MSVFKHYHLAVMSDGLRKGRWCYALSVNHSATKEI